LNKQVEGYTNLYGPNRFGFLAKKATDNLKIAALADKIQAALAVLEVEELTRLMT
jgi:hypothetical protein